jgi:hypothetical protein
MPDINDVPPVAIAIPAGPNVSATFLAHYDQMTMPRFARGVARGPYVAMNMRVLISDFLAVPGWERLIILETDMLPERDAFVKHAMQTEDIVGSLYYMHHEPYELYAMRVHDPDDQGGGNVGWVTDAEIAEIENNPGLHPVDGIGFGCTSIARRVFDEWPPDVAMFRTDYHHESAYTPPRYGEVSHDLWFCARARELDFGIFIDSRIECGHLSEVVTTRETRRNYLAAVARRAADRLAAAREED